MNTIPAALLRLLAVTFVLGSAPLHAEPASVPVEAASAPRLLTVEATLEAAAQTVLAAQVSGRVVELNVDAGDRVAKGALLLRIDSREAAEALAAAEAVVAQAEAARLNARAQLQRNRQLFERGFVSQAALDQAQAGHDAAEAQWRAALAGRGQAGAVQAHALVHAPMAGVIAARHVEFGEMAQPGRPLLTLYQPGAMRAVVDLPQQRVAELGAGPWQARIELPDSGRWLEAASVSVLPAADARTHTIRFRVELPPDTPGVLPGLFARVHFLAGEAARLSVPVAAVLRRGELSAVYVAGADGRFVLRQVRTGTRLDGERIEVLAGLRAGERVALDPVAAGIAAAGRTGGQ